MKYAISCYCFLLITSLKADPIFIYYESDSQYANEIKNIMTDQYSIPDDMMTLRQVRLCKEIKGKSKLDMCINENGDLNVVSVDQRFISESLKVFKAPKGHQ